MQKKKLKDDEKLVFLGFLANTVQRGPQTMRKKFVTFLIKVKIAKRQSKKKFAKNCFEIKYLNTSFSI